MDVKRIVLFTMVLIIVISSLSFISAGVFDGLDVSPTYINVTVSSFDDSTLEFRVYSNDTIDGENETVSYYTDTINVNVTDENGDVKSYNLTLDEDLGGFDSGAKLELDPGTYFISVYYPGDEYGDYAPSSFNTTVTIEEHIEPTESTSSNSNAEVSSDENPLEDIQSTDPGTSIDSVLQHDFSAIGN